MAKSYSEYLQQNPNKAPRTQNPGASGLSYSEIVNNGLQGSLDNGSAYRQQMAAQRAAEQRDAEIQRYLRGYYNALGTHYNNVTADNGQKVTKHNGIYESGKVLENYQNQSGDIMNTIRNAYGNDSEILDAVRSLNTANTDLTQAVRDYAAESSQYRMSQMGENPLADVQERIDRGDRLSREDIALLDEDVSRRMGIPMDEPQQEQMVLNPLSGKDGVLEVARQIREADDRTPLERLRGETVDTTGITDTTIPGMESYAERFGGNVPRQLTESLGVSQIQHNIAESGIRSESELSMNPADNELAEKLFGRIDSVYRDASASADDLRFQQNIALGISKNSANDEWTRSMAREYYDLIESRLESTDAASYLTRRAADAMVDWANNYQTLADLSLGDASTGGSYSEGFQTLTQYAQSHPATYRSVMSDYVGGNRSSAQELADATGVSVSVVRAWQKANEASFMEYQADTAASGLSPWFKENIGDTVYQTASQIPSWALSAVLGGWPGLASGPSSVVDGIATGIQATKNATTVSAAASGFASAVGQGMLNAAAADPALWFSFGIGTMGRTVSQNAMERGYDPRNYLNGALMGFSEVFSENFSGFGSGNNPFTALTTPKGSRFLSVLTAMGNYLLTGAEEGLEELINVPMQNAFDNLTYGGKKLVGTGGIFDFQAMWDAGVSGAVMGAMLGSVGTLTNIATDILSDSTDVGSSAYIRDVSNILNKPEFLSLEDGTTFDALDPRTADRDTILARVGELLEHKQTAMLQAVGESYIRSESLDELYNLADQMGADVQVLVEQARAQGSAVTPELVGEIALEVKGSEETSEAALPTIQPTVYTQGLQIDTIIAALEAYGNNTDAQEYTSDTGYREALSRGSLSENAAQMRSNLYAAETAKVEQENIGRRERQEAEVTPISEETFSNQFSAAYNTGRAYYDRTAEQRAKVVNDYGEWAGTAFDLGAAEVRALDLRGAARARTAGTVSDITQAELQKLFKNGGAIAPSSRNSAELAKMSKGERDAYNRRKVERKAVEYVAKAVGAKVVLYESTSEKTANGWYDHATGTIYLDVKAGDFGNRSMLRAMAHELTHLIQTRSPSEYAALRSFILDKYFDGKQELLDRRVNEAMENDPSLKPEYALDEVIADSCEMMLRDTEAIKQIYNENRGLFNRIKDFIDKVVKALKDAFEGADTYSEAANDMREYWGEIQRLWDAGLVAASIQNVEEIAATGISEDTAEQMVENGLTVEKGAIVSDDVAKVMEKNTFQPPIDDHDVQNSPRTTPAWEKAFDKNYPNLTAQEREDVKAAIRAFNESGIMRDAIGFAADSDPTGFFSNSKFGPLRTNVEYKYTFDMDTSCPRTFQFLAYRDRIQKALGRPLRYWESQNLLNVMRVTGQQIPCTYCYVENKRMLLSASFNNYFKFRDAVMTAGTYEEARRAMYGYNEKKDELPKASQTVLDKWWGDRSYNPTAAGCYGAAMKSKNLINRELDEARRNGTITQSASLKSIQDYIVRKYGVSDRNALAQIKNIVAEWKYDVDAKREHHIDIEGIAETVDEKALSVLNEGMAYAKSASSAKNVENYMPYSGQLATLAKEKRGETKAYIQAMGGLRKHSSNDFRVDYVQDYFLLFADMAAGGWKGHTYTKSVDYVKIFGRTGDRINMSIALNGNTYDTITENSQEGMAWKDARELRDAYPNAGVMCMVTNDAQLSWALDQDWIDMIIPFHSSSLLKEVWSDIRKWMDYTSKQNESFWTTDEMKDQLRAAKVDVDGVEDIKALYFEALGKTALLEVDEDGNVKYHRPHFFPDDTKIKLNTPSGKRTVTIPGHHNDVKRYLELCREYGVRPRFYNATVTYKGQQIKASEHPKFFKLIKETSRIDGENGTGPQEAIKFNFNEYDEHLGMTPFEYALKRMDEERKNGGFNNAKDDPYGIVDEFLDKKNGFIGADKFVDPARVPRYATMMEVTERGTDEWMQDDEDAVQRSSRRSRLSSIDMVEAIDNFDGIDESIAQSLRDVKELYSKYRDNQREVARINEELRGDTQNKDSLEKRKKSLLKTRENLSYQIDAIMEQKGVRDFLEAERTEMVSLFEESAGAGRDYVNRYYNAPMRQAIEAERNQTAAAREQTRLVREAGQERLDAAEREWRERFAKLRQRYSDSKLRALEKQAEEMRMSFRERMERQQERTVSKALRETARNRLARLVNMIETNNDKTHIITELRGPVAKFIEALNPIPQNTRSESARQAAERWREALNGIQNLANENTPVTSLIIEQNKDAFKALSDQISNLESLIRDNSRLTEMGENLQRAIIDTNSRSSTAATVARGTLAADTLSEETSVIDYMNSEQLTQLNRVLLAVQAIVNSANRVFANAKYESRQQMVEASHKELDKIEGDPAVVKVGNGKVEQASLQTQRFLAWRNGTPYYVFKRFGEVGKNLYLSLAKAWGQMSQDVHTISEAVNAAGITEKETQKWRDEVIEAQIPTLLGKTKTAHFTMSQLMSLYCHFRQEQSLLHINGGGFTFAGSDVTRTDYNTYHMSAEEAQALFDQYLSPEARRAADFLQHYMQTVGARMGNVVTRALYGYEYFNPDEYYFPVRASDDQMVDKTSDPTQSLFALLHMTETRARNPKANSKLVVGDIFDIFNSHMADMAKYKNLALPVLDIVNWLNGRTSGGTIKEDLRKAFGAIQNGDRTSSIAGDYVSKFIKDINATYSGGGLIDQEANKFLTRMKKAAVAASLRVALQQPFSYTRAMYTMKPRYLLRSLGIHGNLKQNIDEAMKWSGLARAKSEGAFSSDLSPTLREQIIGSSDWRDKVSRKAIVLAEKMDEVTWGAIWRAAKYQVENEGYDGKFYKKGSNEYFEAVRAVFDEVILSTQVMDGTLTRSEFMRDTTLYSKIMTAFMAEPTLTYNMMLDGLEGVRIAKRSGGDVRQARGKLARAMGTWAATQIANALITALVDSFRDDDDYERFFDKFADHFGANLLDNMNPLDGIPLIKTVWELIVSTWQGSKSPLGTEFQGITQSVKALRGLYDTLRDEKTEANSYGKMSTWGLIYSGLQAVSYLSGLPIANFSRTVTGAYNVMAQVWNDVFAPLNGNYLKHITTYNSDTGGYDELFQAEVNGNTQRQQNLLAELAVHGIDGDSIGKEMRTRTRDAFIDGSIGAQKARSILTEYGFDAESVEEDINFWTFKRDYPGIEKPTSSMANAYYATFQSMGISAPEFAQYWRYIHGDGITKDEVRTYISSLQIPGNVKAALWGTKYTSEW